MRFERWRPGILCRSCWDVKKAGEEVDSSKATVVRSQLGEFDKPSTVAILEHVVIAWPYCQQKAKEEDRNRGDGGGPHLILIGRDLSTAKVPPRA